MTGESRAYDDLSYIELAEEAKRFLYRWGRDRDLQLSIAEFYSTKFIPKLKELPSCSLVAKELENIVARILVPK